MIIGIVCVYFVKNRNKLIETNYIVKYNCVYYGVKSAVMGYDTRNEVSFESKSEPEEQPVIEPAFTKPSLTGVQMNIPHKDEKEGIWYIDDYDDLVAQKRGLMPDCMMLEERLLPEIQWTDEEPTEIEIIVKK